MSGPAPDAGPDRSQRPGYRHPTGPFEWENAVLRGRGDGKLPHHVFATAWALKNRAQVKDGRFVCWPSLNTLAADTGMTQRNIQRQLSAIEAAGWVIRDPGTHRKSTRYQLIIPRSLETPPSLETPEGRDTSVPTLETPASLGRDTSVPRVGTPASPEVLTEVHKEGSRGKEDDIPPRASSYVGNAREDDDAACADFSTRKAMTVLRQTLAADLHREGDTATDLNEYTRNFLHMYEGSPRGVVHRKAGTIRTDFLTWVFEITNDDGCLIPAIDIDETLVVDPKDLAS